MTSDSSLPQPLAETIFDELIDQLSRGVCHQTHRAAKLGYLQLEETILEE